MGDLDFWQKHSLSFLEMALRADKREKLSPASGYGYAQGTCGDTVEIFIQVQGNFIRNASFETNGCLYTVACANTVVHWAEGQSLQDARNLEPASVFGFLETLPQEEFHCAELAVAALRVALSSVSQIPALPHQGPEL